MKKAKKRLMSWLMIVVFAFLNFVLFIPMAVYAEGSEIINNVEINYSITNEFNDDNTGWDITEGLTVNVPAGANYAYYSNNTRIIQCPSSEQCNPNKATTVNSEPLTAGLYTYLVLDIYANPHQVYLENPEYDFDEKNLDDITLKVNGEVRNDVTYRYYNEAWRKVEFDIPVTVTSTTTTKYNVSFMDGTNILNSYKVAEGKKVNKPSDPTKDGYTFDGWYTDTSYETQFKFTTVINKDTNIYAKFNENKDPEVITSIGFNYSYTIPFTDAYTGNKIANGIEITPVDADKYVSNNLLIVQCASTDACNPVNAPAVTSGNLVAGNDAYIKVSLYALPYKANCTNPDYIFDETTAETTLPLTINGTSNTTYKRVYNSTWRSLAVYVPIEVTHQDVTKHTVIFKNEETNYDTVEVVDGETVNKPSTDPTKEGFTFVGWYADASLTTKFDFTTAITGDTVIYAKYEENAPTYEITKGDNQTLSADTDEDLVIVSNGDASKLTGIQIDGKLIDSKNYKIESGSTILTLYNSYLKTLSTGDHTVTFVYTDGTADTTLKILATENQSTDDSNTTTSTTNNSSNPQTVDNIVFYIIMLILSIIGLAGVSAYINRKKLFNK